jgi:hypothetical protein
MSALWGGGGGRSFRLDELLCAIFKCSIGKSVNMSINGRGVRTFTRVMLNQSVSQSMNS